MSTTAVEVPGYVAGTFTIDPGHSDVDGELTLHGVTRPVTLALDVNGFTRDPSGDTRAGFSATTDSTEVTSASAPTSPWTGAAWSSATASSSSSRSKPSATHPGQPTPSATADLQKKCASRCFPAYLRCHPDQAVPVAGDPAAPQ
jgi:hypothetical protein